ncbi:hypothetical protein FRB95_001114 [Tulasnella sp. JGI-2019a]|nr:hypothetical protein FRB95_001114 [Tulasnella sp. JGI-2019a]
MRKDKKRPQRFEVHDPQMFHPINETIDHALSILALSLNDEYGLNYNIFSSNAPGSSKEVDRDVQLMQAIQSSLNDCIPTIMSQRRTYRNTTTSKVYTIPLEIFTRIISESIEGI